MAQLGMCDAGGGLARYQHVETDPAARRQGLAGTLVWHAGRYARDVLGASTLVIVADPADVAIRVYRACGLVAAEAQLSLERRPRATSAGTWYERGAECARAGPPAPGRKSRVRPGG